jgi:Tol biopolymer transport system component
MGIVAAVPGLTTFWPSMSASGRYIAYQARGTNPVIKVFDRETNTTDTIAAPEVNGRSSNLEQPRISADGRYVAFTSWSDFAPGDNNHLLDALVYDRRDQKLEIASLNSFEVGNSQFGDHSWLDDISGDGRFVLFHSTYGVLLLRDRLNQTTENVAFDSMGNSVALGAFGQAALSSDGRYVAFFANASTLVDGDTNGAFDVFVRDRIAGTTERVSVSWDGAQAVGDAGLSGSGWQRPAISGDGRYVAFASSAANLVPGDTNGTQDVFVVDRVAHTTERVSIGPGGAQSDGASTQPSLSADGRYVTFQSYGTNLVLGDSNNHSDTFVFDRETHTTTRLSIARDGTQGNGDADPVEPAAISNDGRYFAFESGASNLIRGGTTLTPAIYVAERGTAVLTHVITKTIDGFFEVSATRRDAAGPIDPTLPTWVIIHGWNSGPAEFAALAQAVENQRRGGQVPEQVLLVDWSAAAASILPSTAEGRIHDVANALYDELSGAGFNGEQLHLIGHSFGSYVAGELAAKFGIVDSIIALDPAIDVGSPYDARVAAGGDFGAHSIFSWAFRDAQVGGRDAVTQDPFGFPFGSIETPTTAKEAFDVLGSSHSSIRDLFTGMLNDPSGGGGTNKFFQLDNLVEHRSGPWVANQYDGYGVLGTGGFEGVIPTIGFGTVAGPMRFVAQTVSTPAASDLGSHGATWPISGVSDFDGNGTSDVLWRSPSTGQVDQWVLDKGHWARSQDLGATKPANWQLAGTGDFDGDGISDVLWRDVSNSQVDQWHMKSGNWAGSIDLGKTKGADWTLPGVGDFNGDGTSDVLWRKVDTSQVDQWQMANGNWSKSIDLGATKGSDWTLAGVGDLNGDGTTDVLWRNVNTSQVDEWQMKNGNWSKSIDLGATKGADWKVAGIGDFNHDGTADVLWFNTSTGEEEYWAMKDGNWGGSNDLGTLDPKWQPSGIGDFNHDGASDALFLDPSTGHVHEQLWMV